MRDFAVFILTNGRPGRVFTYDVVRRCGYTGEIYLLVDDLDATKDQYISRYQDKVIVFNKRDAAKLSDQGDNFEDLRAIIYARNASFEIAKKLGIKYFMQLDDDYTGFYYRFDNNLNFISTGQKSQIASMDRVIGLMLDFYKSVPRIASIAFAQGGDFLGGHGGSFSQSTWLKRKCMNSFLCSTERPFKFIGRVNEDVNSYTRLGSSGILFFTFGQVYLNQKQTQSNSGGMTEMYLSSGTYVKSFYSVMYHPSSVVVRLMKSRNPRLHHSVKWKYTVPKILDEKLRKRSYST